MASGMPCLSLNICITFLGLVRKKAPTLHHSGIIGFGRAKATGDERKCG
jgi:hypothetical protein